MAAASTSATPVDCGIRDVWAYNVKEEFQIIKKVVQKFNYVGMKVVFPGIISRPLDKNSPDFHYQMLRTNVDSLHMIQLGLTFMDEKGNTPGDDYKAWQFNLQFNLSKDQHSRDAFFILRDAGIQFDRLEEEGVSPWALKCYLSKSEVVQTSKTKWIGFDPGFVVAFLFRLFRETALPSDFEDFVDVIRINFPCIYDIKYIITESCKTLEGDLDKVAGKLGVERSGPKYQAGSEALLTGMVFFKLKEDLFGGTIDDSKFLGKITGLLSQRRRVQKARGSKNEPKTTSPYFPSSSK